MDRRVVRFACVSALVSFLLTPSFSQNYYFVIGAFSTEKENIKEFKSFLPGQQVDTFYTVSGDNSLMHFYVMKMSSKEMALEKSMHVQQALQTQQTSYPIGSKDAISTEQKLNVVPIEEPAADLGLVTASSSSPLAGGASSGAPPRPKGKYFKFMVNTPEGDVLASQIHHVDRVKQQELASFDTESYIDISRPGKSAPMTLVCGVFGYKEIEKYIDFNDPSNTDGAFMDENGAWVVPYSLTRLERGDVSVMYNVSFQTDAVMMTPSSRSDLDELVKMMRSNPNYVIKVHAHCNGKGARKIQTIDDGGSLFDISGKTIEKASAKELTNLRAESVRNYLMANGIDKERVKLYGWGGAEMLVDDESPYAKINDRIEIEILKD